VDITSQAPEVPKPGFLDAKETAFQGRQWEIAVMLKENALQLLGIE